MATVVVACEGENVSQHFGRCPFFLVANGETKKVVNPYYEQHAPFAVPDFVMTLEPDVVIVGGMGPSAAQFFEKKGIKVLTANGNAKEVIAKFVSGELKSENNSCEH